MGKSILAVDTPESCGKCPLFSINETETLEALCTQPTGKRKIIGLYHPPGTKKPDWCPLQDAPEHKDKNIYHNERESGYVDGWNACVDKILNGR